MNRRVFLKLTGAAAAGVVSVPAVARAADKTPCVRVDLEGIIRHEIIRNGQRELGPNDQGWCEGGGEAAEFKVGNKAWYWITKPTCSSAGDGKSTVSFGVRHLNGKLRSHDCVIVELVVETDNPRNVLSAKVTTDLEDGWTSGEVLKPVAAVVGGKADAVVAVVGAFEKWLTSVTKHDGKLQLSAVVNHCCNIVLANALKPSDPNPVHPPLKAATTPAPAQPRRSSRLDGEFGGSLNK